MLGDEPKGQGSNGCWVKIEPLSELEVAVPSAAACRELELRFCFPRAIPRWGRLVSHPV